MAEEEAQGGFQPKAWGRFFCSMLDEREYSNTDLSVPLSCVQKEIMQDFLDRELVTYFDDMPSASLPAASCYYYSRKNC